MQTTPQPQEEGALKGLTDFWNIIKEADGEHGIIRKEFDPVNIVETGIDAIPLQLSFTEAVNGAGSIAFNGLGMISNALVDGARNLLWGGEEAATPATPAQTPAAPPAAKGSAKPGGRKK